MDSTSSKISRAVTTEEAGQRLDKVIGPWPEIGSRSKAALLIEEARVTIAGKPVRSSYAPRAGEVIEITLPAPAKGILEPYDFPLEILYEDADVLVVNKPAGLVVHPSAGHAADTLVNALLAHTKDLSMGFNEERPGIVHRIDKETSGLLVVAKNNTAHEHLTKQFQARTVHRIYHALVLGHVGSEGTVRSFLARHPTDRKRYASLRDAKKQIIRDESMREELNTGKWAVTHYQLLGRAHGMSLVSVKLETGRTHQIRVHMTEQGFPLAGDTMYGADRRLTTLPSKKIAAEIRAIPRFFLHARELGFEHPRTGEKLFFNVDWPAEDLQRLKSWGFYP